MSSSTGNVRTADRRPRAGRRSLKTPASRNTPKNPSGRERRDPRPSHEVRAPEDRPFECPVEGEDVWATGPLHDAGPLGPITDDCLRPGQLFFGLLPDRLKEELAQARPAGVAGHGQARMQRLELSLQNHKLYQLVGLGRVHVTLPRVRRRREPVCLGRDEAGRICDTARPPNPVRNPPVLTGQPTPPPPDR